MGEEGKGCGTCIPSFIYSLPPLQKLACGLPGVVGADLIDIRKCSMD